MTDEYNEPEAHAHSEWKQEVANDDAALDAAYEKLTPESKKLINEAVASIENSVEKLALQEAIVNRMEQDWPEIRLRLAAGEAAEWLRRGAPGRALETLEAVLARYEQEESK